MSPRRYGHPGDFEERRALDEERDDFLADAGDDDRGCDLYDDAVQCRGGHMVDPSEIYSGTSETGYVCYECATRAHDEYLDSRGVE